MRQRSWLLAAAPALVLIAIVLPTHWYDTIPRKPGMVLPFSGASLLRITFLVEAIAVAFVALRKGRFTSFTAAYGPSIRLRAYFEGDIARAVAIAAVSAATLLGIILRTHMLGQDLWLDEISPILDYMPLSPVQVIGSYLRSNNHLLNTLLEKISIVAFGEHEWSARLPAVVFGSLTIPLLYWVSRTALSRVASAGGALVLATSYHHVFFSQNARGYTGYLFFALLATGLLLRALHDDRAWRWALYVAAIVLGSASLLITAFVIAGHALFCAIVAARIHRRARPVAPFAARIATVFAIAGFLAFQIYAAALPEVYVVINTIYADPATGYPPFSGAFLAELARGITEGFGSPVVASVFLLIGLCGFVALFVIAWPLATALVIPPVITAVSLAVRGLTFSPRFFLLGLPLVIVSAMAAAQWIAARTRQRWIIAVASVVLALAVGRSLPYYYRTPKQPYRAALAFVESHGGNGRIVVVSNAATGFQYYAARSGSRDTARYVYTRTGEDFVNLTRDETGGHPQVLTTFSRALHIELPDISSRLEREWQRDTTFGATVGDGEITVWSRKRTK